MFVYFVWASLVPLSCLQFESLSSLLNAWGRAPKPPGLLQRRCAEIKICSNPLLDVQWLIQGVAVGECPHRPHKARHPHCIQIGSLPQSPPHEKHLNFFIKNFNSGGSKPKPSHGSHMPKPTTDSTHAHTHTHTHTHTLKHTLSMYTYSGLPLSISLYIYIYIYIYLNPGTTGTTYGHT